MSWPWPISIDIAHEPHQGKQTPTLLTKALKRKENMINNYFHYFI